MNLRLSFTMSAAALLGATPAFAGSLHAPFVFVASGATPYCIITNVNSKPIEVTVSASSVFGNALTPVDNNCPTPPNTLDPARTCFKQYADGANLACSFTAKGKARASVQVVDGFDVTVAIPATAK